MSASPAFRTVVFFDNGDVLVYVQNKNSWEQLSGHYSLDNLPDDELRGKVQDGAVLALVSDAACGHLQVVVPNKKDQYSDDNLAKLLEKKHHIDLAAYEFASQRFPLGREEVQVSVSGVEKEVYQRIEAWLAALAAKKSWLMPFGWFVASLKAVEPALIAVVLRPDRVLVSHHYLGVDDARVIAVPDLREYAISRQAERKETHLLYLHSDAKTKEQVTKAVGESVAVHALLPEDANTDLGAVVAAVMDKGAATLGELLHFEMVENKKTKSEPALIPPAKSQPVLPEPDLPELPAAEDLPRPTLPVRVEVEVEEEPPEDAVKSAPIKAEPEPELLSVIVPTVPEPAEPVLVSQLQPSVAVEDNADRYLEVPQRSNWRGPVLVFLAVAIITGVVGGAILWSKQVWSPGPPLLPEAQLVTPTPEPTPAPTPTPVASESAQVASEVKQQTKIMVLNATGVAGLAGRVKTKLNKAGWNKVQTGNAEGAYDGATFIFTDREELIAVLAEELGVELKRAPQIKEPEAEGQAVVIILAERISP